MAVSRIERRGLRAWLWMACLALGLGLLIGGALGSETERDDDEPARADGVAHVITVEGAISPASADHIIRSIDDAASAGADILVVRLDTPGGLDKSMRDIIQAILASPVPVATYVWPSGARAASAGTYILYASHIAAMAPGTTLGAATPVQVGGGGLPFGGDDDRERDRDRRDRDAENDDEAEEEETRRERPRQPRDAMEAKMVEDAAAYIRGLAELRGRNIEWAERAVREAKSLSSTAAAEQNVVDFVARDVEDLLAKADGRTVAMSDHDRTLRTSGIAQQHIEPDWRTRLLAVLANPNLALILMMIGIYGLIFEFSNPGAIYPGTIGAICLLLGLYSLAILPVDYAGIALILLGVALMVAEAFAPSFGALGIGGAIAFVIGATILFDDDVPGFELSPWVIGGLAGMSALMLIVVLRMALSSHRRVIAAGVETMIGTVGQVVSWRNGAGRVLVHGEHWRAAGPADLAPGSVVRVKRVAGLTVEVEPTEA